MSNSGWRMPMPAVRANQSFEALRASLARAGKRLGFAMNAGMFHPDYRPVGLLVIDGQEISAINRDAGAGNFFLQPNGVLLVDGAARVLATGEYRGLKPQFATQSGPCWFTAARYRPAPPSAPIPAHATSATESASPTAARRRS